MAIPYHNIDALMFLLFGRHTCKSFAESKCCTYHLVTPNYIHICRHLLHLWFPVFTYCATTAIETFDNKR